MAQAIDCHRAGLNHSESVVCASTALRALDMSVGRRYALVAANRSVTPGQRNWVQLRDRCNGNTICLTAAYRDRLATLSAMAIPPPARVDVANTAMPPLFLDGAPPQLLMPLTAGASGPGGPSDQLNRAAGPMRMVEKPRDWLLLWVLGSMLLAEVLLWKMITRLCGKCPHCHHWFARIELDRLTETNSDGVLLPLLRRRRLRRRTLSSNGANPTLTRSQSVSVRRHNQCSLCLHEWETTSRESR
jgi:hypothetical protein